MYSQPRVAKGSFRNLRHQQNTSHQPNTNNQFAPSNNLQQNAPTMTHKQQRLSSDAILRKSWKVGSKVEVYSNSAKKWYEGDVTRIFFDTEGEWLEIQYAVGKAMRLKQIPRDDKDAIRPLHKPTQPMATAKHIPIRVTPNTSSLNSNNARLSATATISSGAVPPATLSATATLNTAASLQSGTATTASSNSNNNNNSSGKAVDEMTQEDIDKQIRNSWVRGSRVEVYSRGRKKWMRGIVTRVFVDEEGEWLEVRYGEKQTLVKESPRDSPDIRPLRVRYKNRYVFTKEHENTVTAIWEEVDLENTRHLDRLLVSSVFRALNIDGTVLREGDLDDVFKWIDVADRGAVNIEEFIHFMTSSVETIKQREIQQRMFDRIDAMVSGKISISSTLKAEERQKLAAIYKSHFNKQIATNKSPTLTSKFTPAPDGKNANWNAANDENTKEQKKLLAALFNNDNNNNNNNKKEEMKQRQISNDDGKSHDIIEAGSGDEMAQFSDNDEDNEDRVSELPSNSNEAHHTRDELHSKLKDVGFSEKFLVATVASQREEYHSRMRDKPSFDGVESATLKKQLIEIQEYMVSRVTKAGVDGLRMSELGQAVHKRFKYFDRKNFLPSRKANFSDFVSLCPGLVVVEMEGSNRRMERIAVTDSSALKINLKSKLQFVLTMLFDKGKITNALQPIRISRDKYGRIEKTRRLSVGERLITVDDFRDRIASLGVSLSQLEGDELFWAVAGSNSTMISQKMVGRYFSSLIDDLSPPIECEVARVLPRVIDVARLRYRREPLWKKYIIAATICRWNNISYLRLCDRRTRSKWYDMIVIPRTRSVHGGDVSDVQKSFHYTCHILNKLQYPTICKKIDHGSDKFNFCCVTATPHLRSFPEMLNESISQRSIAYSEYFISQVMGCICETVLFCHKHDTVNFNLNCDSLGFDRNLRPILLDFSRSIVCREEDQVTRFFSVMSSTPPELALLMGSNNPLMNIELNGGVLRKADSWRCGVLFYVLMTGQLPYHATSLGNFITQVLTLPPTIPIEEISWISDDAKDLLYKLLETTYFNRIDIREVLKHRWFKSVVSCKQSLPTHVIDNIINLCKLENARNWISTITHRGYSEHKQLDRDRKYYGRLDPTGQRKSLRRDKLCIFIMDRLGYCKYRAEQIVNEYHDAKMESLEWKHFVSTYIDIQWNDDDKLSQTKQFTNAIFRGLDPNGDGCVDSKLLLGLFQDINLKLQTIVNKLTTLKKFTFEQTVSTLADAFKNGFDITDLLSVDHVVQSC